MLFHPGEPRPPVPVVALPYQRYRKAPTGIDVESAELGVVHLSG